MKNVFAILVILFATGSSFAHSGVVDYNRVCNYSLGPRINFKDTKTMNQLLQHLRDLNYRLVEHDSEAQMRLEALSFVCHAGQTALQPKCSEMSAEVIITNLTSPGVKRDSPYLNFRHTVRFSGVDSRFFAAAKKSSALLDLVSKIPDCSHNGFIR